MHHLQNALRAKELYKRDVDYVVTDGEVKIVDEFTGRVLEGRRYSEGLHQAIEAKEGVRIKEENQTLATITIQNYFKMYDKLSGMTGTAKTQLDRVRGDLQARRRRDPHEPPDGARRPHDLIYKNEEAKWDAVVEDIRERNEAGQPILVGTVSIEKSERLSGVLNRRGIEHHVLNAKNHETRGRRSSRRPGAGERSPSRRTWPAVVSTSCSAATPSTSRARRWRPRSSTTTATCCSRWSEEERQAYETDVRARLREAERPDRCRARRGRRPRRPLRVGHRAARVTPHRQPAPRTVRSPGRPRRVAVLPVARGRPDADVRLGPRGVDHGALQLARGRADRGQDGLQGRRERPAPDRGTQLRAPEERPEVRRGDERATRGDLRGAPQDPRGAEPEGAGARLRRGRRARRGGRMDIRRRLPR